MHFKDKQSNVVFPMLYTLCALVIFRDV